MAKDTQRYKCVVLLTQVQEKKSSIRALEKQRKLSRLSYWKETIRRTEQDGDELNRWKKSDWRFELSTIPWFALVYPFLISWFNCYRTGVSSLGWVYFDLNLVVVAFPRF